MSSFVLLIACLVLGTLVARFANPPASLAPALHWWVINVALPALVLQLVPTLEFEWHLWFLVVSMWFVLAGSWGFFALLGKVLHWPRKRVGALAIVCGLGNTSFIGFPMIEALRGQEALRLAVVADQAGCFLSLAIGGTILAAVHSGHRTNAGTIARRVLFFPPFVSLLIALLIGVTGGWHPAIDTALGRIGSTLVPLALFSVGLQFHLSFRHGQLPAIGLGLAWKLLFAPAIVYLIGRALGIAEQVLVVATLESAMAPMISAAIMAQQAELEPPLANTLLGAGIVLSFATVPLWNAML